MTTNRKHQKIPTGGSGQDRPVTPPSITCKREAPRGDWDTDVVSAVGTSMLKSAPSVGLGARGDPVGSATYGTQGVTRLRLARATGPMDWRHVGPDPAHGTDRWLSLAPAGAGTGPVSRKVAGGTWVRKTNVSLRFDPRVRVLRAQPCPIGNCFPVVESSQNLYFVGRDRSRHQHNPPSISGLTWPRMLRVFVWSDMVDPILVVGA
ncbi:hypothetical protein TIFTF001_038869 [Ficus carica]|uniref:Uncharacterized protein n=1 Tax=Ficus carica TaxID=3494 RepID=A0AA88ECK2_FICCA|nr:hypothetical protein TIFTF001_038869 [Ficus carica]